MRYALGVREHVADDAGHSLDLFVGERRIDRNLHRARGAPCARCAGRDGPLPREEIHVAADVHVQRFDVDALTDTAHDQLVALRAIDAVLVVHVRPIRRHVREPATASVTEEEAVQS